MADCICDNVILTAGGDIKPSADSTTAINIAKAAGTNFVTFDTTNERVAIGAASPGTSKLLVSLSTAAAADNNGIDVLATQTAAVANTLRAIRSRAVFSGTSGTQTGINGLDITVEKSGTGGTISFVNVISPWAVVSAGSTISNLKMLAVAGASNSGTITNFYGVYVTAPSGGTITNKYALVTEPNAGNVGIGITNPAARLHVDAGAQANGTDAVRFVKTRSATNGVRYAFEDVGGLTGDANGGPYWRGLHLAAPTITDPSGGANVFPRLGFFAEYNSLTAPSTRNWVIQPDNDTATSRHQLILRTAAGVNALTVDVSGNVRATNEIKVWDSGWFAISALQTQTKNHTLGAVPKGVTVLCGQSTNPATPSLVNGFVINTSGSNEYGAYVARLTTTSLVVRAGNFIGINEANNGWLTTGYYKIIAWA